MRIAMVSEHANPLAVVGGVDSGGQNVHVDALAAALEAAGHQVTVYTRRDERSRPLRVTAPGGYTVVHLNAGPAEPVPKDDLLPYVPALATALGREFDRDRPDVVHAHFWMSGLAALQPAHTRGIPVVLTFHALGAEKRRHQGTADTSPAVRIHAERLLASRADAVVATARSEVAQLAASGVSGEHVHVVPCGVDTSHFTPGLAGTPGRLLALGRLVPRKGIADTIRAVARVPRAELLAAGGPPRSELRQDPEARRLQELARQLGVADRVRFLGAVGRDEVPELIRACDAVVCLPWYEPFGIVPLEAMACGRPVVASVDGGLTDTVVPRETGYLVPPRDPAAAARAIAALLADPAGAAAMGARGRLRVERSFTWPAVAAATVRVYSSLTTGSAVTVRPELAEVTA